MIDVSTKKPLNKQAVKSATRIHELSLKQAMKAASIAGWDAMTIKEVANLDYNQKGVDELCKASKANKKQSFALKAVYDAAKFGMLGNFALSQA